MSYTSPLVEFLAEKVHDAWMAHQRFAGIASRTSVATGEEMMVRYDDLSERVKERDRESVRVVLTALTAAGYTIVPVDSKQVAHAQP